MTIIKVRVIVDCTEDRSSGKALQYSLSLAPKYRAYEIVRVRVLGVQDCSNLERGGNNLVVITITRNIT